jgi:predicted amidohydrolase YtcJ
MRLALLSAAALLLSACTPALKPETEATEKVRVFTNATIYTGLTDAAGVPQTVTGVLVGEDGRIMATIPPMSADWGEDEVEIIDLGGAFMYPGFTDAHAHLLGIGERELTLNLEGTASVAELVTRVEAELEGKPEGSVLVGRGWIETGWPEGRMPMASDLDAVTGTHKVILGRSDGHALVANTAALKAAGITNATPDPDGGRIERDASGKATGILIDNAMALVEPLIAKPDDAAISLALETGAKVYASRGWTGMHNMSVDRQHAPLLKRLHEEGRLPQRIYNAFNVGGLLLAQHREYETARITNRAVKLYMDGALGSRGAQLIAPYTDRPDMSGLSLMDDARLAELMAEAKAANVQLAIHAIGDLANRRILDAVEAGGYGPELRWRIEHTQVVHPDDLARIAALGLIASMQPSHAIGDLKFAPARLGIDRLRGAYAWATLLDLGTVVAGGSDAPVEFGSPTIEFYAAVARKDLQGASGEGWHPEEAVSRTRALALFTTGPAYAAFQEADLGTIEQGKFADFTVFDRDLMTVPEADILKAQPLMTVIAGDIVWQR